MTTARVRPASGKLDAVQILRAAAALMVVIGHVIGALRHRPDRFGIVPEFHYAGGAGVDIFFLISGFIMVIASTRMFGSAAGSRDFMLRRLVRIVPLYWGVTMLVLALAILGHDALPSVAGIAASFAFVPFDTLGRANGFAFPIVDLGWTLNYEMMFYVVFALFIPLARGRAVAAVAVAMAALVALGMVLDPTATAPRFWTQPIILEFVAGMLVALAHRHGRLALAPAIRIILVVAAVGVYLADPFGLMRIALTPNDFSRVLGWGMPSLLLLTAAVAGPTPLASRPARGLVLLGDASYALYLLHPFVIAAMLRVADRPVLPATGLAVLFVVLTVVGACVGAIIVHKAIERPLTTRLTRALQRGGAPIGAVPLTPDADVSRRRDG